MSGGSRALPDRPNLRYLRLEAKRRLAAGEFATLHDAQTAIAREYGEPSWAALKQLVRAGPDGHAVAKLRWVISRFSGADERVAGARRGRATSLAIRIRDHRTHVVLTSRLIPVNAIDAALLRLDRPDLTGPTRTEE